MKIFFNAPYSESHEPTLFWLVKEDNICMFLQEEGRFFYSKSNRDRRNLHWWNGVWQFWALLYISNCNRVQVVKLLYFEVKLIAKWCINSCRNFFDDCRMKWRNEVEIKFIKYNFAHRDLRIMRTGFWNFFNFSFFN